MLAGGAASRLRARPPVAALRSCARPSLPCARHRTRQGLPDADVVRVLVVVLLKSVNMTGKNQSQILQTIVARVKTYHKALAATVTNAKLELTVLVTLQVRARWRRGAAAVIAPRLCGRALRARAS